MNAIELLNVSNKQAELSILFYMVDTKTFIDIPTAYFYTKEALSTYLQLKETYEKGGVIEPNALPIESQVMLTEIYENFSPTKSEFAIEKLKLCYQIRESAKIFIGCMQSMSQDDATVPKKLSDCQGKISNLLLDDSIEYDHAKSAYAFLQDIEEARKQGHDLLGISSAIETLDKVLNGWQKKKTYIVAGMEKLGKSRFCLELTSFWASKNIGGIWFSMEMQENDIHECVLANRLLINTDKMGTSLMTAHDINKICMHFDEYSKQPLYICTKSSITPEYIRSIIRRQKIAWKTAGFNCVYVIVDYIQRMVDGDNKAGRLEDVAKKLADIARDESVIMIIISQLSQEAEKEHNKDTSPHKFIKGSKGIREAADCMVVLYNPEEHFDDQSKTMSAYIVQRKGKSNIPVKLVTQLQYSRFRGA